MPQGFQSPGALATSKAKPRPPVAVDLLEAGIAHPRELRFDGCELVLGIAVGAPDPAVELGVELGGGAPDDLEVGEHPARPQGSHRL